MAAILATCQVCNEQVVGSSGYLWIDLEEAVEAERAARQWKDEHQTGTTVVDLIETYPAAAMWRVHHQACDPAMEACAYDIGMDRLVTPGDLLTWTSHLMQKSWLAHTDWDELIRGAADGTDARLRLIADERAA
jgi:hypothetical protein